MKQDCLAKLYPHYKTLSEAVVVSALSQLSENETMRIGVLKEITCQPKSCFYRALKTLEDKKIIKEEKDERGNWGYYLNFEVINALPSPVPLKSTSKSSISPPIKPIARSLQQFAQVPESDIDNTNGTVDPVEINTKSEPESEPKPKPKFSPKPIDDDDDDFVW